MSVEALWAIVFSAPQLGNIGSGCVVLESGKIYGGDANYYYLGTYLISGNTFAADVDVHRYNPAGVSIFGPAQQFKLKLRGTLDLAAGTISASGNHAATGQTINIAFKRLAALP